MKKYKEKWWKTACQLQMNFDDRKRVSWHQLMFHIKWWVLRIIMMLCFLLYNTFEYHFQPVRLSKIGLRHPVALKAPIWHKMTLKCIVHMKTRRFYNHKDPPFDMKHQLMSADPHCKCFVCRNRRRSSAISIPRQFFVISTYFCLWSSTIFSNIFAKSYNFFKDRIKSNEN